MAGTNHRRSIANWWLLLRAMAAYITTLLSIRCEQVFVHLLPSLILHPYFLFWLTAKLCEILPQQFSTGSWYLTPLNVSQFFSGLECNDAMKREQGEEEKKIAICPACEWLFLKYLFYIYIYAAVAAAVSCWLCMMYGLYGVAPANMMHTYPHIQDGVLRLRSTVWTFPFISNLVFFLLWSARLSPTIDILLLANCADMPSHMTYTAHTMLSYAIAFGWFAKKKIVLTACVWCVWPFCVLCTLARGTPTHTNILSNCIYTYYSYWFAVYHGFGIVVRRRTIVVLSRQNFGAAHFEFNSAKLLWPFYTIISASMHFGGNRPTTTVRTWNKRQRVGMFGGALAYVDRKLRDRFLSYMVRTYFIGLCVV